MLNENIQKLRKQKGLSQEELAQRLHVVRQTVSKWEQGLSVPDAQLIVRLAEELDTTVSTLLGEGVAQQETEDVLQRISDRLEELNGQFARMNERRRRAWRIFWIVLCILAVLVLLLCLFGYAQTNLYYSGGGSVGIIGGADGPTAVLVAGSVPSVTEVIAVVCMLLVCGAGIWVTRRK